MTMMKMVNRVEVAFGDREVDSVEEDEVEDEDMDSEAEMTGTRGVTVVAAGPVIDVTAGGGAGLVTVTAAEDTRVGDTREAEAETEIEVETEREVEIETEAEIERENDVAATVIDHATDVVVGEAMMMNRLTGTTTVKVQDTAAEVQTDSMTHMAWSIMTITDNLLDCSATQHCTLVWYMLTVPYDTFISPVKVAEHIVKLSLGKILMGSC